MPLLHQRSVLLYGGLLVSVFILGGLVAGHHNEIRETLANASPWFVGLAAAAAAVSYVLVGLSLWEILRLLDHRLGLLETLHIGFISTAMNYILSTAGLSGFAVKALMLRRRHVPYGTLLTASAVSSVFCYLILVLVIAQGLLCLALKLQGSRLEIVENVVGLTALVLFTAGFAAGFFHHEFRTRIGLWVFHSVNRVMFLFSKKNIPREDFDEFDAQIARGLVTIRRKGWRLAVAVAYIVGDWFCCLLVLDLAFRAVGHPLGATTLLAGFGAGMLATLIPFLPAGMGAMEGSMAAVFSQFGVPWDLALSACLIFRLMYYLLPGALSIVLFWFVRTHEPAPAGGTA